MSAPAFAHRGVIEGFYGTPWRHEDRLWWIDRLGTWGMNRYVHAPKDDPLHRERWREPYPADELREFAALVERGHATNVDVGFAFSPGLSIGYADAGDRRALRAKLEAFREIGARWFALCVDDVPSELVHPADRRAFHSLAEAHATLAHELAEAAGPESTLWLVPTDYLGVGETDYLGELGDRLDPAIEIGWTGRTVLSPRIASRDAESRARALGRRLLVWDNTPVADGPMRSMLHLGPYAGRDPDLARHVSGILLNPMRHARASALTVGTAARYLADPSGYDPERAFREVADEIGVGAPEAFALFARAHRFSPLAPDDRDVSLEADVETLRSALTGDGDFEDALRTLRTALDDRARVAEALRRDLADRRLAEEIEPWIESHAIATARMLAAATCLERIQQAKLAKDRVFAFVAFEGQLTRLARPGVESYGPRRVLYPQLASMRDDTMALTDDPTLIRDRCLADDLVALAERHAVERVSPTAGAR